MDLNAALHTARCGGHVRDDANMTPGWKLCFVPYEGAENLKLPGPQRSGAYVYINPKGEQAHPVRFSDAMKASSQWRTMP